MKGPTRSVPELKHFDDTWFYQQSGKSGVTGRGEDDGTTGFVRNVRHRSSGVEIPFPRSSFHSTSAQRSAQHFKIGQTRSKSTEPFKHRRNPDSVYDQIYRTLPNKYPRPQGIINRQPKWNKEFLGEARPDAVWTAKDQQEMERLLRSPVPDSSILRSADSGLAAENSFFPQTPYSTISKQSIKKSEEITTSVIGAKQPIPRHVPVPPHMRHYPQQSQDKMQLEGQTHQPTHPHSISSGNLISKSVVLPVNSEGGYGFTLRQVSIGKLGLADEAMYRPTTQHPALQYLHFVEPGSLADSAGLKSGDFVTEVNGEIVSCSPHRYVVQLIKNSRRSLSMTALAHVSSPSQSTARMKNVRGSKHTTTEPGGRNIRHYSSKVTEQQSWSGTHQPGMRNSDEMMMSLPRSKWNEAIKLSENSDPNAIFRRKKNTDPSKSNTGISYTDNGNQTVQNYLGKAPHMGYIQRVNSRARTVIGIGGVVSDGIEIIRPNVRRHQPYRDIIRPMPLQPKNADLVNKHAPPSSVGTVTSILLAPDVSTDAVYYQPLQPTKKRYPAETGQPHRSRHARTAPGSSAGQPISRGVVKIQLQNETQPEQTTRRRIQPDIPNDPQINILLPQQH